MFQSGRICSILSQGAEVGTDRTEASWFPRGRWTLEIQDLKR